jgi:hypothetical protein
MGREGESLVITVVRKLEWAEGGEALVSAETREKMLEGRGWPSCWAVA